jgi:hypothetical protein
MPDRQNEFPTGLLAHEQTVKLVLRPLFLTQKRFRQNHDAEAAI